MIRISNKGEIEPEAFTLIGASTKRDDNSKIGYFGSGLKYAMIKLIRENISINIFSGKEEIKLSKRKKTFRGKEFEVLYINEQR